MRWVILVLYFFLTIFGGGGTLNYIMIPDIVSEYYGVSNFFITWTAIILNVAFIPLVIPIVKLIKGKSVRRRF